MGTTVSFVSVFDDATAEHDLPRTIIQYPCSYRMHYMCEILAVEYSRTGGDVRFFITQRNT